MKNKGEKKFAKIAISIIISILLFVGLIVLEKNIVAPNGTAKVVIATQDIQEHTVLDENEKNLKDFFEVVNIDGKLNFQGAITNIEDLNNMIMKNEVKKGEIISAERLISKDDILEEIENPIETSIRVTDISQIVGGVLREGDIINIAVVNSTTNENIKVLENVYVTKAISSDGKEVDRNSDLSALTINIIISAEDEAELNKEITQGTVRISKIK